MKDDLVYELVKEADYQRTANALEREIDRLKSQLLPAHGLSVIERDKQQTIWLELDRLGRYLACLRDKAIDVIHVQ